MKANCLICFLVLVLSSTVYGESACSEENSVVGQITIDVQAPHDVIEDNLDSAWMKIMYIPTSHSTIQKYLNFSSGQQFNLEYIQESIRKLRAAHFIWDATYKIIPVEQCKNNIEIIVFDTFPFKPKLAYSRRSGTSKYSIGVSNTNLFGTGTRLQFERKSEKLRDQNVLQYDNPDFGDGHYLFSGLYSDNTDGKESSIRLAKPFYALDSKNYYNFQFNQFEGDLSLYDNAAVTFISPIKTQKMEVAYGINYGSQLNFERSRMYFFGRVDKAEYLTLSQLDRNVITAGTSYEIFDSDFVEMSNITNMTKTEDYDLGTLFVGELGLSYDQVSQQEGLYTKFDLTKNLQFDDYNLLLTHIGFRGEYFGNELDENHWYGNFQFNQFEQNFESSWNVKLEFDVIDNPRPENYLVMDEEFGIRGYPYGYALGDKAVKLNIEKRWFNVAQFFDVFDIAAVTFFDAAVISVEESVLTTQNNKQLQSVGFGLRISPTKLSNNTVVHIDFGVPLSELPEQSYQLNIYAKSHF